MNSAEFTCLCGKTKGWITEGEEHPNPCPVCGRRYKGEYDHKNLTIKAIEIKKDVKRKRFQISTIVKNRYVKWYPSFHWMYAGYRGFDRGLYFTWFNKMIVLIRPINERN